MRSWISPVLMCLVACAGGVNEGGPNGNQAQKLSPMPPPASQLPDGGMTVGGAPASDAERLRTQLQWFAATVKQCEMTQDSVRRSYATAQLQLVDDEENGGLHEYDLRFVLGSAASTDTYNFPVDLLYRATLKIEVEGATTTYLYSSPYGWAETLHLTTDPAGPSRLATWDSDGDIKTECSN